MNGPLIARKPAHAMRLAWAVLAAWVAVAALAAYALPSLPSVVSRTEQSFIPQDAESAQASKLLQQLNPTAESHASAVVVFARDGGLTADDREWMIRKLAELESRKDELGIVGMLDARTQPELASRFVSGDGTTMLSIVYLPWSDFDDATKQTLALLQESLRDAPTGTFAELTGSAPISQDFQQSSRDGLRRTEMVTVCLVLAILLIVFRSPFAPIVPLATIGISLLISRGIVAWTAGWGLPVTNFTESFLVAVLFGAGTDYCILMIQRYREELTGADSAAGALRRTLRGVGPTILYATSTVFAAFSLIGFADFGLYKSGVGVAIGLLVMLLASMTLCPALMLLLGKGLFWPRWPRTGEQASYGQSRLWTGAAMLASRRSILVLIVSLLVLTPFTLLFQGKRSFDDISEIDPSLGSVAGYRQTEAAFGAGELFPITMVVTSSESLRTASAFAAIEQASAELSSVPGVREVRSATRPLGEKLSLPGSGSNDGGSSGSGSDSGSSMEGPIRTAITTLAIRAASFSQGLVGIIPSIRPIFEALAPIVSDYVTGSETIDSLKEMLKQDNGKTDALVDPIQAGMQRILRHYMSPDGSITKIDIVMSTNPFADETMDAIGLLSSTLRRSLDVSVVVDPHVYASGATAKYNELRGISYSDFVRTGTLVLAGIAVVLMLLLRSVVRPLLLLAALVFNYLIAMGLLEFLYVCLLGFDGLSWTVSFFIFMVVVALGVDYSIFLMARYREELRVSDRREAMVRAMTATGGVILSAAAIMAGTFGALAFSGVDTLVQIGVGTMIGLLLYATVFMSLIVPALTFLADERSSRILGPRR